MKQGENTMKTKLISMLLAGIMLVSLAACANDNDKPGSTPEESTKETDVQTTENVTTTEEDTTEPEEAELMLNTEVFSDLGLTYSQIAEKRGKLTAAGTAKAGVWYNFENGFGQYFWSWEDVEWDESAPPRDENNNIIVEFAPLPKDDIQCVDIAVVDTKHFLPSSEENIMKIFSGSAMPETFAELEDVIKQTPDVTNVKSWETKGDPFGYYEFDTYSLYGEYNNSSVQISVRKADKLEIDSILQISICKSMIN